MPRRRRQWNYNANADINIANLVDVVLVLLIIFMISAPLLQSVTRLRQQTLFLVLALREYLDRKAKCCVAHCHMH